MLEALDAGLGRPGHCRGVLGAGCADVVAAGSRGGADQALRPGRLMRRGGGAGRVVAPGVREALIARERRSDGSWHLDRGDGRGCTICAGVAELESGGPVQVSGELVWRAMFDERHPDSWDRFLRDETVYVVTGPDTLLTAGTAA